ncbi:MAG TPA: hypothetical protein VFO94_10330 [Gammaproteobacteria bacterium]|nr:hypothetical protein [Gammaproteobacteria bacterium]
MAVQPTTLEILEKADLPPKQARAIAQAIEIEIAAGHGALATRADLLGLQHGLESQLGALRHDHESQIGALRRDHESQLGAFRHDQETQFGAIRQELDAFRRDHASQLGAFKHDHELQFGALGSGLELKMAEHKSELVRWVFLCILGQSAMLLGVGYFLVSNILA